MALHYRQISRTVETQTNSVDDESRQHIQTYLAGREQDWSTLEARLKAFASQPVFSAVQASSMAHRDTIKAFESWRRTPFYKPPAPEGLEVTVNLAFDVEVARQATEDADDAVVDSYVPSCRAEGAHWAPPDAPTPGSALGDPRRQNAPIVRAGSDR